MKTVIICLKYMNFDQRGVEVRGEGANCVLNNGNLASKIPKHVPKDWW